MQLTIVGELEQAFRDRTAQPMRPICWQCMPRRAAQLPRVLRRRNFKRAARCPSPLEGSADWGGQAATLVVCDNDRHEHAQCAKRLADEARGMWGADLPETAFREVRPGCEAARPGDERFYDSVREVFGHGGSLWIVSIGAGLAAGAGSNKRKRERAHALAMALHRASQQPRHAWPESLRVVMRDLPPQALLAGAQPSALQVEKTQRAQFDDDDGFDYENWGSSSAAQSPGGGRAGDRWHDDRGHADGRWRSNRWAADGWRDGRWADDRGRDDGARDDRGRHERGGRCGAPCGGEVRSSPQDGGAVQCGARGCGLRAAGSARAGLRSARRRPRTLCLAVRLARSRLPPAVARALYLRRSVGKRV
ncbi:unnamed protein product [Prorocentrum cordatum]|uniref:Uncharacterized protein n=1 Tax=Prorocentrum cordatum TaxID=2364126 RepID=A0ABN9Q2X5_9DINO|nr:unnamed protein product [Polarella glacialis]